MFFKFFVNFFLKKFLIEELASGFKFTNKKVFEVEDFNSILFDNTPVIPLQIYSEIHMRNPFMNILTIPLRLFLCMYFIVSSFDNFFGKLLNFIFWNFFTYFFIKYFKKRIKRIQLVLQESLRQILDKFIHHFSPFGSSSHLFSKKIMSSFQGNLNGNPSCHLFGHFTGNNVWNSLQIFFAKFVGNYFNHSYENF